MKTKQIVPLLNNLHYYSKFEPSAGNPLNLSLQ